MVKSYPLLKPLADQLIEEVRAYGIPEVSLEQYQVVCNSIVRFAQSSQVDSYSPELMDPSMPMTKMLSSGFVD